MMEKVWEDGEKGRRGSGYYMKGEIVMEYEIVPPRACIPLFQLLFGLGGGEGRLGDEMVGKFMHARLLKREGSSLNFKGEVLIL